MDVKLTLKLDSKVIKQAKNYAIKRKGSLSKLVENYFKSLSHEDKKKKKMSPIVSELAGTLRNAKIKNYKEEYADYLTKKYS